MEPHTDGCFQIKVFPKHNRSNSKRERERKIYRNTGRFDQPYTKLLGPDQSTRSPGNVRTTLVALCECEDANGAYDDDDDIEEVSSFIQEATRANTQQHLVDNGTSLHDRKNNNDDDDGRKVNKYNNKSRNNDDGNDDDDNDDDDDDENDDDQVDDHECKQTRRANRRTETYSTFHLSEEEKIKKHTSAGDVSKKLNDDDDDHHQRCLTSEDIADVEQVLRGVIKQESIERASITFRSKLISCLKKSVAFFFTTVGSCCLLVAYTIFGGCLFISLEAENEKMTKRDMIVTKKQVVETLWNLTLHFNVLHESNWTKEAENILQKFTKTVLLKAKKKGWDGDGGEGSTEDFQWNLAGSILYSITVVTTIGYGHIAPKTDNGKIATILYAIVGIPLTLFTITNLGSIMATFFRFIYSYILCGICRSIMIFCRRRNENKKAISLSDVQNYPTSVVVSCDERCLPSSTIYEKNRRSQKFWRRKKNTSSKTVSSKNTVNPDALDNSDSELVDSSLNNPLISNGNKNCLSRATNCRTNFLQGKTLSLERFTSFLPSNSKVVCGKSTKSLSSLKFSSADTLPRNLNTISHQSIKTATESRVCGNETMNKPSFNESLDANRNRIFDPLDNSKSSFQNADSEDIEIRNRENVYNFEEMETNEEIQLSENQLPSHVSCWLNLKTEFRNVVNVRHSDLSQVRVPVSVSMVLMMAYVALGLLVFGASEKWSSMECLYFCFTTLSTIGFGDYVPGVNVEEPGSQKGMIMCAVYLLFGLALIAMCFDLIQEEVKNKFRSLGEKLGLIDSNNESKHKSSDDDDK